MGFTTSYWQKERWSRRAADTLTSYGRCWNPSLGTWDQSPGPTEIRHGRRYGGTRGACDARLWRGFQRHAYAVARAVLLASHGHRARRYLHPGKPLVRSLFRELSRRAGILRTECGVATAGSSEHDECPDRFSAAISPRYRNDERGMYARHHA